MKKYQVTLRTDRDNNISGKDYLDSLLVSLARQGYDVFFDIDGNVAFNCTDEEVFELPEK